jgi:hypothetical protein
MSLRHGIIQAVTLVAAVVAGGCNYSFRAGSFPPPHIRTIAVQPFDNETPRFEISGEVYEELLRELPRSLGINTAGEDLADAIVRGTITRYDVVAPNYRAGDPGQPAEVLQRQVSISASIQIVDLVDNVVLWEDRNVVSQGEFLESESEDVGRAEAIRLLIQKVVDGAQSNW